MHEALYYAVVTRLLEDAGVSSSAADLVEAACRGDGALNSALAQLGATGTERAAPTEPPPVERAPAAHLASVEVAGFRGIGPSSRVDLNPGPGLTVVLGRNGSGKSSFAEGLEVLLTETSRRWVGRPLVWKEGWRCLHSSGKTRVSARFCVEGRPSPMEATRTWGADDPLEAGRLKTTGDASLADLGWTRALSTYRPFLSSRDLAAALEKGTSKLYDEMKSILGLSDVTDSIARLSDRRKALDRARKESKAAVPALLGRLDLEDPRALSCKEALSGRKLDLDAVEEAVVGGGAADPDRGPLDRLRTLANLPAWNLDEVAATAQRLRTAAARGARVAGTQAAQAARLADLLEAAIEVQAEQDEEACPVCRQDLPPGWQERASQEIERSRTAATAAKEAAAALAAARRAATRLLRPPPPALAAADVMGLGTTTADAWTALLESPDDPAALADHLEARGLALAEALDDLRSRARDKLEALQDRWRPVATALAAWLEGARAVEASEPRRKALVEAEKWLKAAEGVLRDARFAPIAQQAQTIWAKLRQQSSVDLTDIRLAGTATRRKVELDVAIDGREGVALGVMSQGELNALALSLFLPRMLLDDSPFRFLIVDDPIQSMDPGKVDGLAEVLGDVARSRQVIVFTHDPRLGEALRRLRIDATVLKVARRGESVVEVRPWLDPVRRHLYEAKQLTREEDRLGPELTGRVVPGLCRMALEAACAARVRRTRLAAGVPHEEVQQALSEAHKLHALVTLALFDDPARHAETYGRLSNQHGAWAIDLLKVVNEGSHFGWSRDLPLLVDRTRRLAQGLLA